MKPTKPVPYSEFGVRGMPKLHSKDDIFLHYVQKEDYSRYREEKIIPIPKYTKPIGHSVGWGKPGFVNLVKDLLKSIAP